MRYHPCITLLKWNVTWKSQSHNKTEGKHDNKQNHSCGILSKSIFNFSIFPFSNICNNIFYRQVHVIKSIKLNDKSMLLVSG